MGTSTAKNEAKGVVTDMKHRGIKWHGLVGLLALLLLFLGACGRSSKATTATSDSGYAHSISKGLDAVAENKISRAQTYFDNALTQKPNDKKAQAYRQQTQAYLKTKKQLQAGQVDQAVTTVAAGLKIKGGAKSLTSKLTSLQSTAKADLKTYQQLKKDVTAQLKVTDGNYDAAIIKRCQKLDWQRQPYLKSLKPQVEKLLAKTKTATSSSAASASSSASNSTVSAADQKTAAEMRKNIVQADPGTWNSAELAKVPDEVIVAATKKSDEMGGDPGTTANMIAKQYPAIKNSAATADSAASSSTDVSDKAYLTADEARQQLPALAFYQKNSGAIQLTSTTKGEDAWKFGFTKGSMRGTITVENKGIISAETDAGKDLGMGTWR